jgi:hypothetical protein
MNGYFEAATDELLFVVSRNGNRQNFIHIYVQM